MRGELPDPETSRLQERGVPSWVAPLVYRLHDRIRDAVRSQLISSAEDELSAVIYQGAGDVSFGIDVPAEKIVVEVASEAPEPLVVIAEGLGTRVFPAGAHASDAGVRLIVDPLDGSRELMYRKRSAFVLSGVAVNQGDATDLSKIVFGVLTEVPPLTQSRGIRATAIRGDGAYERVWDLESGAPVGNKRPLLASHAPTIRGGFATFVHFFPGTHAPIGILADDVLSTVLGPVEPGTAGAFEDSYLSTGGQLYLLASGRYRLIVDARPFVDQLHRPLCAHPYDLAGAALIAEEAGAILTDLDGGPIRYPLDTDTECGYVAYANEDIRAEVEPALTASLRRMRQRD